MIPQRQSDEVLMNLVNCGGKGHGREVGDKIWDPSNVRGQTGDAHKKARTSKNDNLNG